MTEKIINTICEKTRNDRWEDRQVSLTISQDDLRNLVRNLKNKFKIHLSSISAIEHHEYLEIFYYLIVGNVPLNVVTILPNGTPFKSIKDLLQAAVIYEGELQRTLEKRVES
jgi:NADH:ubiquinone oxidoreductase subunit C